MTAASCEAVDGWRSVLDGSDRWWLGLGSCLGPEGMAALPDKSVAHLISDPPYSKETHERTWSAKAIGRPTVYDGIDFAHLTTEQAGDVSRHASRIASRWSMAFTDVEGVALWRASFMGAGLDYVRTGAWVKPDATPQFTGDRPAQGFECFAIAHPKGRKRWNGGGKRNVYTHCRPGGGAPHPTTKPLDLMLEILADFTDPDDIVCDPFAGSGTTAVACLRLGRRFIGWELSPDYHAIACRRIRGDEAKPRREQPSLFDHLTPEAP